MFLFFYWCFDIEQNFQVQVLIWYRSGKIVVVVGGGAVAAAAIKVKIITNLDFPWKELGTPRSILVRIYYFVF